MGRLVSWGRRGINEISTKFVGIVCQHGGWEAGRLVLEDDLPGAVSLLLVEPNLRIEKKKVWYVFILRESFPVDVTA